MSPASPSSANASRAPNGRNRAQTSESKVSNTDLAAMSLPDQFQNLRIPAGLLGPGLESHLLIMEGGKGGAGGAGGIQASGDGGSGGTGKGARVYITAQNVTNMHTSPAVVQASQVLNHCPPPSRIFQGQQTILDAMHQFFAKVTGKQHLYVLYGLDGAGNTQIALKFIEEFPSFPDQLLVDASSTETIETGLKNIALAKELGNSPQDTLKWLGMKHEAWLVFFDNAGIEAIPHLQGLIACIEGVCRGAYERLDPPRHQLRGHQRKLKAKFKRVWTNKSQVFPKNKTENPREFLSQFMGPNGEWDSASFVKVTKEIMAYSLINFDAKQESFSIHPLVHDWSQTTLIDQDSTGLCMGEILGMSIMELPEANRQLTSLSLISHVDALLTQGMPKMANDYGLEYADVFHYTGRSQEAARLEARILEKWRKLLGDDHRDTLRAMNNLASTYHSLGQLQEAEKLQLVVLEKQTKLLGDDHLNTLSAMTGGLKLMVLERQRKLLGDDHLVILQTMRSLAVTYGKIGQFEEAEKLQVELLDKCRELLGDSHTETVTAMNNLGWIYYRQGQFGKAEELQVAVVEKQRKLFGDNHPDTQLYVRNLALTYCALDKQIEAEELEKLVIACWQWTVQKCIRKFLFGVFCSMGGFGLSPLTRGDTHTISSPLTGGDKRDYLNTTGAKVSVICVFFKGVIVGVAGQAFRMGDSALSPILTVKDSGHLPYAAIKAVIKLQ
ncbi:hypothetical protein K438DRAFT_1763045 [Mycena galopus ATCC 62051]|nr:hypothetical protein K438DRAFT_1763045 [Mycena galopus ATCC 62051]